MSAYIIENESISNIVNSFFWLRENDFFRRKLKDIFKVELEQINDDDLEVEFEKFGQLLVNLNQESINQRYNEKTEPFKFKYIDKPSLKIHQFLKSLQHFTYQSCEGDCDQTELYKLLIELEHNLMWRIIGELDDYKKAKWE